MKKIGQVRFIGNYGINPNGDMIYLFTDDLDTYITNCKVTHYMLINERFLSRIIERVYKKKKDEPLDFKKIGLESHEYLQMSTFELSQFNTKINNFRYGQEIQVLIKNDKIAEIRDFYPKPVSYDVKLCYSISKKLYDLILKSEEMDINLTEGIVPASYEVFNMIWRYAKRSDPDSKLYKFVQDNFKQIDFLENQFVELIAISFRKFIGKPIKEKDVIRVNEIFSILRDNISYFKTFYQLYKEIIVRKYPNEINKVIVPRIDGKKINVIEKKIEKKLIQAHVRTNVKMGESKRQEILALLETNNLEIKGIPELITKNNFENFNWNEMTIVNEHEKDILSSVHKSDDSSDYTNKEFEKSKKTEQSNLIHNKLVKKMAYNIEENKYKPHYSRFIDLYYTSNEKTIIFEMKSINRTQDYNNEYSQLMKAFSQLEFYPFIHKFKEDIIKVVVCSEKITDNRLIEFLKLKEINIVWLENEVFTTMKWSNPVIKELLLSQVVIK